MKKGIIFLMLFFGKGCSAQNSMNFNNNINMDIMEKFDKVRFEANKTNGEFHFISPDDDSVRQWENKPEYYIEERSTPGSPYEVHKKFYYDTGNLQSIGEFFYDFHIGIWKEYDNNGKITKEINDDSPYKFSIDDLNKKMKEFGITIMIKKPKAQVQRDITMGPRYTVIYPVNDISNLVNVFVIDGTSGDIISRKTSIKESIH